MFTIERIQRSGSPEYAVTTLSQVYDNLLGVGLSATVNLADYLRTLCVRLPELQAERTGNVRIAFEGNGIPLGLDEVTTLGMAVAEIVTNSYKHAFPDRDGTITVTLAHRAPTIATLTVQDDGIGIEVNGASTGHGRGLVERLVEKIGGTVDVHSKDGTVWTLTFPVVADGTKAAA